MAEFKRSYQQDLKRMQAERDDYSKVRWLQGLFVKEFHIKARGKLEILKCHPEMSS